jgi:hypothetical protein
MHFLTKDTNQPRKNFAYWRDLVLGSLGAICIVGCLGHILDWMKSHNSTDRNVAFGFLFGYFLLGVFSPGRLKYIFLSLVAIIAWGILGAISHASLIGFVVIIPCAVVAYALLRWRGEDLLK